jgi:hypothetical protein
MLRIKNEELDFDENDICRYKSELFSGIAFDGYADGAFVSSVGLETKSAADSVARMHGAHRFPSLLKRVDQLARRTVDDGPQDKAADR